MTLSDTTAEPDQPAATAEPTGAGPADLDLRWEPPGPGSWSLDDAHFSGSATPVYRAIHKAYFEEGMRQMMAVVGAPVSHLEEHFVHGRPYSKMVPLVGGDSTKGPPPAPILWAATRLHPGFRRRRRTAAAFLDGRPWREVAERWNATERAEWSARNRALQDEAIAEVADAALAQHLERVVAHVHEAGVRHFVLHAYDMGPLGLLLVHSRRWGLDPREVLGALAGSSPATTEPTRLLRELGELVAERSTTAPTSLDEVRALGDDVAALLDAYLAERGCVVITRYDVDGHTLAELPEVVLGSILAGAERAPAPVDELVAGLRARVPEADRAHFDRLLDEARAAYGMRDDNGPMTIEWPLGILRRALLEVGRRLTGSGRLQEAEHVFELELDEVLALLRGAQAPTAVDAAARADRRRAESAVPAPATLGPVEDEPDMSILPAPFPLLLEAIDLLMGVMDRDAAKGVLEGAGIGTEPYRGRARVATDAASALAVMDDGDVVVAPFTGPAWNSLLPMVGALVVEEGGAMCHAAIVASEFSIPAVVGVVGATAQIPDGAEVEVDPVAGAVRIL
jgi:rifampicin phosphotransferase